MHPEPHFEFDGWTVRRGRASDAEEVVDYFCRNQEHIEKASPLRTSDFYTADYWQGALESARKGFEEDRLVHCFLFRDQRVLGALNLGNFVRGAFHACYLGYSIDREYEGRGVMFEAVKRLVDYAFSVLAMHRVMANHMPDNERSAKLLHRLGFRREGYAEKYLLIGGQWRDHVLTAKINPSWAPPNFQSSEAHVSLLRK